MDERAQRRTRRDRLGIAVLAGTAGLMFFFPLLTVRVPVAGETRFTGYQMASLAGDLRRHAARLPALAPPSEARRRGDVPVSPWALRAVAVVPVLVVGALACALATVLAAALRRLPRRTSTAGAAMAAAAVLVVVLVDVDLRRTLRHAVASDLAGSAFAPLGRLAVDGFALEPGIGLWVLAGALALAAFVAQGGHDPDLDAATAERGPG